MNFQIGDCVRVSSFVSEIDGREGWLSYIKYIADRPLYGVMLDDDTLPPWPYWLYETDMVLISSVNEIQISTLEGLV